MRLFVGIFCFSCGENVWKPPARRLAIVYLFGNWNMFARILHKVEILIKVCLCCQSVVFKLICLALKICAVQTSKYKINGKYKRLHS